MNDNSLTIGKSVILKKTVQNLFAAVGQTGIFVRSILACSILFDTHDLNILI